MQGRMMAVRPIAQAGAAAEKAPILFFTINHMDNTTSRLVIPKINERLFEKKIGHVGCMVFASGEAIAEYFLATKLPPRRAVAIFDGKVRRGRCFKAFYRGMKEHLIAPDWSPAYWSVVIRPELSESRIISAANQIVADHYLNYFQNIAAHGVPWGRQPVERPPRPLKQWKSKRGEVGLAWQFE